MHTLLPSTQEVPNNARRQANDKTYKDQGEATFPVVLSFFFLFFFFLTDCIIENLRDSTI